MIKILVVDDETDLEILLKQKFRRQIREQYYEFIFAYNGKEALNIINGDLEIDILLSDINMPEMDGLTLLSKLYEQKTRIKTVMVSAYGDMENIRTAMNLGAFDFVTKPINFVDLERTIEKTEDQVKQLKTTLSAIKENNILKMYVDETVINFMTNKTFENSIMVNESIEATVVFFDICSFTTISENEPPDVVVTLLNEYFDVMVKEIIEHGGLVDKFIGDAIMAIFKGEFQIDRAIDASIAIRDKINNSPKTDLNISYRPQVSIGINCGEMIYGNVGSKTLKRLDYTVIGDSVNIAQRLQNEALPGQILISEKAYEIVKESFECQKVKDVILKNRKQNSTIYEVLK